MRKTTAVFLLAALCGTAQAQSSHYVQPHIDRNGNFVQGHMQTNPDSTRLNNWSSQGNTNPYTGQAGTVNPYPAPSYPQVQMPQPQMPTYPTYPQYPQRRY